MNQVEIRVFLNNNEEVAKNNEDNEWLASLLSGEVIKEKKIAPPKIKKIVSNPQLISIRGNRENHG